jgi:hypothetical protein
MRNACVCEISRHGYWDTTHLRFSLYSQKCHWDRILLFFCVWQFLSFYTDNWRCIMRSWAYLTTSTSYKYIWGVLKNKECGIYNGYTFTLRTRISGKKKFPTFLFQQIEYFIKHGPNTTSNSSSIVAWVFVVVGWIFAGGGGVTYTYRARLFHKYHFSLLSLYNCGIERREYGRRVQSLWPRGTLYLQKFSLTLPTSGGRSVGIVRSRTQATEYFPFI